MTLITIRDGRLVRTAVGKSPAFPAVPGQKWWVTDGRGNLVATNHPLWRVRVGRRLNISAVAKTLKLELQ